MTFTPKAWGDFLAGGTPVRASSLIDLEQRLAAYTDLTSAGFGTQVKTYVPNPDGVTDNAAGLAAAINAAALTGWLVFDVDATYLSSALLTISSPMTIIGNGSTLLKGLALNDYNLAVTSTGVTILDLNINGNRAAGNIVNPGGINWSGASGVARRCKVTNVRDTGWTITGAGVLDAYECQGNDVYNSAGQGNGFMAISGGILRGYSLTGNNNGSAGVYLVAGAGAGCYLDGTFNNNSNAGIYVNSSNGRMGSIVANNNANEGVHFEDASDWSFDYMEANDSGQALNGEYTPNPSANGGFFGGCTRVYGASFVARRCAGYGLELVRSNAGNPSTECMFSALYISNCADPAVIVAGASTNNTFGALVVADCTVAVSFGESAGSGDRNHFDLVHAVHVSYAVVRGDVGSYNTIDHIVAIDCTQGAPYVSFVKWDTAFCVGNVIERFDSYNPTSTAPDYLMECTVGAADNAIHSGTLRTPPVLGLLLDAGTNNRAALYGGVEALTQAANYTLVLMDTGTLIEGTKATAQTVTVPPNSSVAFPIGTVIQVAQMGAGQITLTPGAGVTIRTARTLTTRALYSVVELRKRAVNEWVASGDLT